MNSPTSEHKGLFLVVSGPSGAGKTSICRELLRMYSTMRFSVSYTTRPPRPGEVEGRDYCFISKEEFLIKIRQKEFAEWVENYGHYYGTSAKTVQSILEEGDDLMVDVEPRGARSLKESVPSGVFVFILPPTLDELKARLCKRAESEASMKKRLAMALDEIREVAWYDYVIINDRLDDAVDRLRAIYIAEKSRRERLTDQIKKFL